MVIARFDVFRNPSAHDVRALPYVLVLQSPLLDRIDTRVVAPLARVSVLNSKAVARLNPQFEIDGHPVFMLTQQIGALPARALGRRVANLESERSAITAALDLLFSGI